MLNSQINASSVFTCQFSSELKSEEFVDLKNSCEFILSGEKKPAKMDITGINPNSLVKLNVGGTIFMTTQGTLLADQNSMLAKMFSPETNGGRFPAIQDENGAYFIDSCPRYFGITLNFLRIGVMEKVANVDLKFLRNYAEYFWIQGLVKIADEEIEKTEKEEALRLAQFKSVVWSQEEIARCTFPPS